MGCDGCSGSVYLYQNSPYSPHSRIQIFMQVQYKAVVDWDNSLVDVGFVSSNGGTYTVGLASCAIKITAGAPNANTGRFILGSKIINAADGSEYRQTSSGVWSPITPAGTLVLPDSITDSTTTTTTSFALIISALTTGIAQKITAAALTTGAIFEAIATAATLTTGRYFKANDGSVDVWGIGANGHIHSNQATPPTVAVGTANGITAASIGAGSSDTAGTITTTGTNNNSGDSLLVVTFNKTYTTAPKSVHVFGTNTSGAKSQVFASVITASAFTVDIPASASAGATPSFSYIVIA